MGAFKKLSMDRDYLRQQRAARALKQVEKAIEACPNGCRDVNNLCPSCEEDYVNWLDEVNEVANSDVELLKGAGMK